MNQQINNHQQYKIKSHKLLIQINLIGKENSFKLIFNDFFHFYRRSQEIADNVSDEFEHIIRGGSLSSVTTGSFSSNGQHHQIQQVEKNVYDNL